jgi:zinc transport system substrate-binding protein
MLRFFIFLSSAMCFLPEVYGTEDNRPIVFTSIIPLQSFVERIGGPRVAVKVFVEQGQAPETYEPQMTKMVQFADAKLFLGIGLPFEKAWIGKLQKINPTMQFVDVQSGSDKTRQDDPHLWSSPRRVIEMTRVIRDALIALDPSGATDFIKGQKGLEADLIVLDKEISEQLKPYSGRHFLVFHAAWGHFADDYGLVQLVIEDAGKEIGPKGLIDLMDLAKKLGIKTIFTQKQFSTRQAEVIARKIGAEVVISDPLAEDYFASLREFTTKLVAGFVKQGRIEL